MRYVKVAAAFVITLWVGFMAAVFLLISVMGPHSPPPSRAAQILAYVACVTFVVVLPIAVARRVWVRGASGAAQP